MPPRGEGLVEAAPHARHWGGLTSNVRRAWRGGGISKEKGVTSRPRRIKRIHFAIRPLLSGWKVGSLELGDGELGDVL